MRVKSPTKSFHNIIILVIFAIGLFVIYRYVKNIEYELKITNATVSDLSKKYNDFNNHQRVSINVPVSATEVPKIEEMDNDEDTESIQSNDITNMLKKVMMHDISDDDFVDNIMNMINEEEREGDESQIQIIEVDTVNHNEHEEPIEESQEPFEESQEPVEESQEPVEESQEPIEESENGQGAKIMNIDTHNSIGSQFSESTLMSKTNEQLKTLLKGKGLSAKGQKSELVKRLLEN
jgi:hypothetical protein